MLSRAAMDSGLMSNEETEAGDGYSCSMSLALMASQYEDVLDEFDDDDEEEDDDDEEDEEDDEDETGLLTN